MDGKVFLATFSAVFFAELADKTQLVAVTMSAKSARPWTVWFGSICAYAIITAITVLIGAALGQYIKPQLLRYVGALMFLAIGVLLLLGKI